MVAARADREQQPRRPLGELGLFPRARARRSDHVRPDDGRLVDLHRLAGHPAGHVRDVRRRRAHALRRLARRPLRAHGGPRRHGRRAAARRDDERRRDPRRRRRRVAHRQAPRDGLLRSKDAQSRRSARLDSRGDGARSARSPSDSSATRPRCCPSWCARRDARRAHRPDERARYAERLRARGPLARRGAALRASRPARSTCAARTRRSSQHVQAMLAHAAARRGRVRLRQQHSHGRARTTA